MLTLQYHPDRAKRRGISNHDIRDISHPFDMTPRGFYYVGQQLYYYLIFKQFPKFYLQNLPYLFE